ncbi:hypothetical protein DRO58_00620 [Candidatus Bathyarchaeota archaeon]|nr:MAG: hypothetical protein DRO58_00620 [Candidatus Bathyarchaeota archaeon]
MGTVTVKIDEELRRLMRRIKINWSEYIREAIRRRVELEERREAASWLLEVVRLRMYVVPGGFIYGALGEGREGR